MIPLDIAAIEEVLSIDIADSRHQTAETVERAKWTLAILAALRTAEAERDTARSAHAELAASVRAYLDADREWQRSRVRFIESIDAAAVERTESLRVDRETKFAALDAALGRCP